MIYHQLGSAVCGTMACYPPFVHHTVCVLHLILHLPSAHTLRVVVTESHAMCMIHKQQCDTGWHNTTLLCPPNSSAKHVPAYCTLCDDDDDDDGCLRLMWAFIRLPESLG